MLLSAIEEELRMDIGRVSGSRLEGMHSMLAYHMGWEGPGAGLEARGKRLRPLILLLTTASAGGDWHSALPAAAAVELVHNFSLIHDDIEDQSPLRHGRPTLWARWGEPQAINAGDAMFSAASLAILDLEKYIHSSTALHAARLLHETCLHLTEGQYLDISYELRKDLSLDDYWPMVTGKTAALISASTRLGALIAGAPDPICQAYTRFGHYLGLAFQALDDLLGVWGDAATTGKSVESDLVSGKKSLPVLFSLEKQGAFAKRWKEGPIQPEEVAALAELLIQEGAHAYTQEKAGQLTDQALQALGEAAPQGDAGSILNSLALRLLKRER